MYKPGQWRAHCDVCGFKFYSGDMRQRWDGLMVCQADWEADHPQKYLRVPSDTQSVPWVRELSDDTFKNVCYLYEISAYAGLASAGCAQAGNTAFSYTFLLGLKS
jgi:hypothetical protein